MRKKQWGYRIGFYLAGILILALGLTLNTKTGMGVSPMLSISYSMAEVFGWNFGDITFAVYLIFVAAQFAIRGKNSSVWDLLQLPFNVVFTRLLNVFGGLMTFEVKTLWGNLLLLALAIVLTGIGAATVVNAQIAPNPADGLVFAISQRSGKDMGFVKNVVDVVSVLFTVVFGMIFAGKVVGVGLGTFCAVVFVGRIIWLYNKLFQRKIAIVCGLEQPETIGSTEQIQAEPA